MCQLLNFTPCPSFGSNFTVCDIFKCLERIWNEWTKPLLYVLYTLSNIVDVLNRLSCAKLMVKSTTITIKNYVITAIKHKNLKGSFKFYLYFNIKIILFELYLFFKYEILKFLLIPKGNTRAVQGVHTDHKLQTERRQLSSLHSLHTPVLLYRTPIRHFPCIL